MTPYAGGDDCELFAELVSAHGIGQNGPPVVLMHGGGPDHTSMLPLANRLAARGFGPVLVPDVRGYGRSICRQAERHTWSQYSADVVSLLDAFGIDRAVVGGAGMGGTVALRLGLEHSERCLGLVAISLEDIEDDDAKEAESRFMEDFAERVRTQGLEAAWRPIIPTLAPVIGAMVADAIPRSDPASIAAAAAIGRDRSFRSVDELAAISAPTLIFSGMDYRHPQATAEAAVSVLPHGCLGEVAMTADMVDADGFGEAFAPAIDDFLVRCRMCRALAKRSMSPSYRWLSRNEKERGES